MKLGIPETAQLAWLLVLESHMTVHTSYSCLNAQESCSVCFRQWVFFCWVLFFGVGVVLGPQSAVIRAYSGLLWLCTQGSLLFGSGYQIWCWDQTYVHCINLNIQLVDLSRFKFPLLHNVIFTPLKFTVQFPHVYWNCSIWYGSIWIPYFALY